MNPNTTLAVVAVILIVVVIAWLASRRQRTTKLKQRFGPEYERLVSEQGGQRRAEAELRRREHRVEKLTLRPLLPEELARYTSAWTEVQARFVDDPRTAVGDADHLVGEVMSQRGYPVTDFDQRAADISVDHPVVVQNYRAAHDIAARHQRGIASTEELRKALLHYRELFRELLQEQPVAVGGGR